MIATTLEDAADLFSLMQDQAVGDDQTAASYVDPPGARLDPNLPPIAPVRVKIADRLIRRRSRAEKVFVTGQKGAGKTMTLAHLARDPKITEHFAPVVIRATRHIPAGSADVRLLLVMLIAELSRFIDAEKLDERVSRAGIAVDPITKALGAWTGLFSETPAPSAPESLQSVKLKLSKQFVELNAEIVRDAQRRAQVLEDKRYSVTDLSRVASALIDYTQRALTVRLEGPQFLLLVIDDLDKYTVPSEVRSIFYDGLEALRSLPCAAVLTYPYFLNFTESFVQRQDAFAILNVKVAERAEDAAGDATFPPLAERALLEPAREFFNRVYEKLASRALVLDQSVIDRAALLSAGIPREFLRLLSAGFELCLDYAKKSLDLPTLEVARIQLQQTMARTANEPWKQAALKLVQTRGSILGFTELLDTVHVVEYVNSTVWFGVHPAMEDLVAGWIRQDKNLLLEKGSDPEKVHRELDEMWRRDAGRRDRGAG